MAATSDSEFHSFPRLPLEIQSQVWNLAVPDPRSVKTIILFYTDLNLGKPKGFLPSKSALIKCCIAEFGAGYDPETDPDDGSLPPQWVGFRTRRSIYSLMHTCRDSRSAARQTYRLDLASIIAGENVPLWSAEEDLVYFRSPDSRRDRNVMFEYLRSYREIPLVGFDELRHAAFDSVDGVYAMIQPLAREVDAARGKNGLPASFHGLTTLTLLFDIYDLFRFWDAGVITLHEPYPDILIEDVEKTAAELEDDLEERMGSLIEGVEVPMVDVLVMDLKPSKK